MGRGPFGIMFQPSKILSCLFLVVWATSINAESETILCTSSSDNEVVGCGTVTSLPDQFICNLEPAAVRSLSQDDALILALRLRENCVMNHKNCWKTGDKGRLPLQSILKCFLHKSHLHREEFVKNLRSPRLKRSPDAPCPVTDEMAQNEDMPIEYDANELRTCLRREVLLNNLGSLMEYAFSDEQMMVIKEKLDEIYPDGYPDSVLQKLGALMSYIRPEDIKKWRLTSHKTLASLLANSPSELSAAIIRQYTDSGGPMNAEALNAIGTQYICLLDSDQLKMIDEHAIKGADPLDPSGCNQTTKDILYPKAKRAFSDRHNPPKYYKHIITYLGGAPGMDLTALSKDNVNMNMSTFMGLRSDAIMELTPSAVKGLLGTNLKSLKDEENNPLIKNWIVRQKQSELDKLNIGLEGGTPEGYMNITPRNRRPPETSGATSGPSLHLFPSLLLTLLLTTFLA